MVTDTVSNVVSNVVSKVVTNGVSTMVTNVVGYLEARLVLLRRGTQLLGRGVCGREVREI